MLRNSKEDVLNMKFFNSEKFIRYHELFTKVYIGYMKTKEFEKLYPLDMENKTDTIYVSIEKEHTGKFILTYFMQHSRKNLDNIMVDDEGKISIAKKDPYGITVSEVTHINKTMHPKYHQLFADDIKRVQELIS